ncbi:hypothetical protein HU200_053083 [Digitaria exilis]|uniref:Uncharacterized protein n=1 Tax=Digitaria exilis TaxID=1010633 RepID=A0A835E8Z8_9POAL|nr:hypothetical protein HU200_053083 [Digitaria exilis]
MIQRPAVLPEALGKSKERAFISEWACYLYAFSRYSLHTWLYSSVTLSSPV